MSKKRGNSAMQAELLQSNSPCIATLNSTVKFLLATHHMEKLIKAKSAIDYCMEAP